MICYECDNEFEEESHEYDGHDICEDCYDASYCKCTNCRDIVRNADITTIDNEDWCEDCFNDNWYTCTGCSDFVHNDDALFGDDDPYCESCYSSRYTYVECCESAIRSDDAYYLNHSPLCEEHYNEQVGQCSSCGRTLPNEDLWYDEEDRNDYCNACRENASATIHSYGHKPPPVFRKLAYENTLFIGTELEVETDEELEGSAKELRTYMEEKSVGDRFYFKWDSSLKDGYDEYTGFEIVSHPSTLKYWHQSKVWYSLLEELKKQNFKSYKSGKCGLHFHVNKSFFKDTKDFRKLALFFWYNRAWLKVFAMRDSPNYSRFYEYTVKSAMRGPEPNHDRHLAINFTNRSTIEFRIFRGTLNHDRFLASMQFVDALCHFVLVVGMAGVGKYCFREFMNYLRNINRYDKLEHYLRAIDMQHNFDRLCSNVEQ